MPGRLGRARAEGVEQGNRLVGGQDARTQRRDLSLQHFLQMPKLDAIVHDPHHVVGVIEAVGPAVHPNRMVDVAEREVAEPRERVGGAGASRSPSFRLRRGSGRPCSRGRGRGRACPGPPWAPGRRDEEPMVAVAHHRHEEGRHLVVVRDPEVAGPVHLDERALDRASVAICGRFSGRRRGHGRSLPGRSGPSLRSATPRAPELDYDSGALDSRSVYRGGHAR